MEINNIVDGKVIEASKSTVIIQKDGEKIYLNAEKLPHELSGNGYMLGFEAITKDEILNQGKFK